MGSKDQKRKQQLRERADRQAKRQRDRVTTGLYLLGHADATPAAFARECEAALARHPSLRRVIEYPFTPGGQVDDQAILAQHGLAGHRQHLFTFDDADSGYGTHDGNLGGHAMFFHDEGKGADFSVVLLRQSPTLSDEAQAAMNMGVLFHELGHVDDFERGLSLIPGRRFDVVAGEYYANLYACRHLRDRRYMVSLCAFMAAIEGSLARCGVPSVEASARRLIDLEEYQAMRRPLRPIIKGFEATFGPPAYKARGTAGW